MDAKHAKPTKAANPTKVGKPERTSSPRSAGHRKPGTERARDEARRGGGPRYGGGPWETADERGDRRFGHARTDEAEASGLGSDEADADSAMTTAGSAGTPESSGQVAGMRRGEKPRKVKARER